MYIPDRTVCDGDISSLYIQAIERENKFIEYIASVYDITIADHIVTQYTISNINPSAVDNSLRIKNMRLRT
ncbi:hypothetical protein [Francisella tularensis]|uniref:hypothetical protein n=1 Tax=Francisella tularensis TaxID=263 RepID=UPI001680FF44|nr:hypothetical protein [Francisella tularensis]MBD2809169.1 hypothetical protein [Francisella tularensis]